MGNSVGPIRKISWGNTTLKLSNDLDANFFRGGWIPTEALEDIGGQVPKVEFKGGELTGITNRCSEPGSYTKICDLITKTTEGDVEIVVTLSNNDKFSAPCFAVVDKTSFFSNQDGKAKLGLYPRNSLFSPV